MQDAFIAEYRYTQVKNIVLAVTMIVSISLLYFGICEMTPLLSKSPYLGSFGKAIRLANSLRALVVVSPYAIIGTGVGALMFSIANGNVALGAGAIIPAIVTSIGLYINRVYKEKTFLKDLFFITIYGILASLVVSTNLISMLYVAGLFNNTVWLALMSKIGITVATMLAGYPLVILYRKVLKKD